MIAAAAGIATIQVLDLALHIGDVLVLVELTIAVQVLVQPWLQLGVRVPELCPVPHGVGGVVSTDFVAMEGSQIRGRRVGVALPDVPVSVVRELLVLVLEPVLVGSLLIDGLPESEEAVDVTAGVRKLSISGLDLCRYESGRCGECGDEGLVENVPMVEEENRIESSYRDLSHVTNVFISAARPVVDVVMHEFQIKEGRGGVRVILLRCIELGRGELGVGTDVVPDVKTVHHFSKRHVFGAAGFVIPVVAVHGVSDFGVVNHAVNPIF